MQGRRLGGDGLWVPQEMWGGEGRLLLVFYCSGRDQTGGLGLREQRENIRFFFFFPNKHDGRIYK